MPFQYLKGISEVLRGYTWPLDTTRRHFRSELENRSDLQIWLFEGLGIPKGYENGTTAVAKG